MIPNEIDPLRRAIIEDAAAYAFIFGNWIEKTVKMPHLFFIVPLTIKIKNASPPENYG